VGATVEEISREAGLAASGEPRGRWRREAAAGEGEGGGDSGSEREWKVNEKEKERPRSVKFHFFAECPRSGTRQRFF
jgi:hypothetical protein